MKWSDSIFQGQRFGCWSELTDAIHRFAGGRFQLKASPRNYEDPVKLQEITSRLIGIQSEEKLYRNGVFYCNAKGCPYRINFGFVRADLEYQVGLMSAMETHSHEVGQSTLINGFRFIEKSGDLSLKDRKLIERYYVLETDAIKLILTRQNPGFRYHSAAVNDVRRQFVKATFGGADAFDKFVQYGPQLKDDGGVFHTQFDATGKFARAFMQPAGLIPYAEQYGDYVQVDGTFCMCVDQKILLALVVVDALNHTVPAGWAFVESENSSVS
jgi:hypothetical protein